MEASSSALQEPRSRNFASVQVICPAQGGRVSEKLLRPSHIPPIAPPPRASVSLLRLQTRRVIPRVKGCRLGWPPPSPGQARPAGAQLGGCLRGGVGEAVETIQPVLRVIAFGHSEARPCWAGGWALSLGLIWSGSRFLSRLIGVPCPPSLLCILSHWEGCSPLCSSGSS